MLTPPFLKRKDKVAIIGPAKRFEPGEVQAAIQELRSWDLDVVEGKNIYHHSHMFSATDQDRADDLQQCLNDPDIKAVIAIRGGYGTSRIIDQIDFTEYLNHPKWIVGFSDITVLISHLNQLGVEAIHGIMPILFDKPQYQSSVLALKKLLFGETPAYNIPSNSLNIPGEARGKVVGGNLTILHTLMNTPSFHHPENKILFIEDISEYLYHLDRMMVHLKRAGIFSNLKGLIVGHFTDMKDNEIGFGKNAYEIILDAVKEYGFPVCFGFPVGHDAPNMPIICGRNATFKVNSHDVSLSFETPFFPIS